MSGGQKNLADHPFIVIVVFIFTVLGGLVAVKELLASDAPPPAASGQPPAQASLQPSSRPNGSVSPDAGSATRVPPVVQETERSGTDQGTTPSRRPASEPENSRPVNPPSAPAARQSPQHTGPLTVRILMGSSGKIGPNVWRARSTPGANTEVYDATGRLDTSCYVQWTLKRAGEVVKLHSSGRCRPPSITLFNFDDSLREVGTYTLQADVTTDWGQSGSKTIEFEVAAG
ncbi:hypothetical protein OHA37_18410 [Streptomyces sp. NBC_00335]|uniref:hypothetical protein n=1 Tax=unclassified Streptomyces TaxID=2593676 RepID=UPI0022534040|nr:MULTISPECIES: hypothetical protein [unclassified Streptomyces]MCX5405855.1 hypothetical protein [Streptomyces sp. NBC_00086]